MISKKHLSLFAISIFVFMLMGMLIVRWTISHKISEMWMSLESRVGNQVSDFKWSTLLALQSSLIDTIARAQKSVVSITISKDIKFYLEDPSQVNGPWTVQQQTAKIWWWSGIIISKKWYVITNKHVVQDMDAKYSVTLYDGKTYNVDKIRFDDLLDLAVLKIVDTEWKIPADLLPASFLPLTAKVQVGQFVLAIGNSLSNYANNTTLGIIWGKNKQLTVNKNNRYIWLYQTDALVNPGNSWGPLIDIEGNVLGITTAITEGQWIAFALPLSSEFLSGTIRSIDMLWKIARPVIWIQYKELPHGWDSLATGISITDVLADLPARQAGLKIWDIVMSINDTPISSELPFLYQLYTYIPGDAIRIDILRGTQKMTLDVVLWPSVQ